MRGVQAYFDSFGNFLRLKSASSIPVTWELLARAEDEAWRRGWREGGDAFGYAHSEVRRILIERLADALSIGESGEFFEFWRIRSAYREEMDWTSEDLLRSSTAPEDVQQLQWEGSLGAGRTLDMPQRRALDRAVASAYDHAWGDLGPYVRR